ncbi:MAG: hypothetical protein ACRDTV_00550 [Mycobacterium sp.]
MSNYPPDPPVPPPGISQPGSVGQAAGLRNGVSRAALILGIIASLLAALSWFLVSAGEFRRGAAGLALWSMVLVLAALVCGVIGLIRVRRGKGTKAVTAVVGMVLAVVALVVVIVVLTTPFHTCSSGPYTHSAC